MGHEFVGIVDKICPSANGPPHGLALSPVFRNSPPVVAITCPGHVQENQHAFHLPGAVNW